MASLQDLMNKISEKSSGGRSAASVNDVKSRMEIYKENNQNFDFTVEHEIAMLAIFRDLSNVFITGGAGTGKTTFLRDIVIQELEHRGLNFAVTATTGIAGSHLGGKTVHSWGGIGLGPYFPSNGTPPQDRHPDDLYKFYEATFHEWSTSSKGSGMRDGVKRRIKGTEVLIIDEISMCAGAALLGYLDFFFKKVRDDERPFGGMQIIFCGDLYQLPPVEKTNASTPDWAFLSSAWINAKVKVLELTKVFRQADQVFSSFLNNVRKGEPLDKDYVQRFVRQLTTEESMCASYLVPTNAKADKLNNMVLGMYPGPTVDIPAKYEITPELLERYDTVEKVRQQLETSLRSKSMLSLRIGVPVLFKINDRSDRYVNGTKGFVVRFLDAGLKEVTTGDVEIVEVRIPKRGNTEEQLVQVQRWVTSRNPREDPEEMSQCADAATGAIKTVRRWPVVKQFPLIPATAITIHSAQGMSLDECVVDLHQTFAPGHVYVAMSRLRTAEGLTLASDRFNVLVDPHVTKFYNGSK